MRKIVKCPLKVRGSKFIHRRPIFETITASEWEYFTRYAGINAKPEVQR